MKAYISTIIFFLIGFNLHAQIQDTLNQEASPIGGITNLAVKYYGIDFTKEQRALLQGKEIEFIFQIDEAGNPTLSEVNGIEDRSIMDSLIRKTEEIQKFNPLIRNGIQEPSIYFMKLTFPTYKMAESRFGLLQGAAYSEAKLEDFEYIHKSSSRFDMLIGGMTNQFIGNPSNHLGFGGGMKVDISITDKHKYLYGLNMSVYGNKLKKDYPLSTNREQFAAPPTLLVGAVLGKWIKAFNVQSEFNFAVQNITEKNGENDPEWIQLKGWSPGVVLNYPIKLGKEKPMYYYGSPTLYNNNLNVHFGLRYLFLSIKEASGLMTELGISYRMTVNGVKEYKLKDEFLRN